MTKDYLHLAKIKQNSFNKRGIFNYDCCTNNQRVTGLQGRPVNLAKKFKSINNKI